MNTRRAGPAASSAARPRCRGGCVTWQSILQTAHGAHIQLRKLIKKVRCHIRLCKLHLCWQMAALDRESCRGKTSRPSGLHWKLKSIVEEILKLSYKELVSSVIIVSSIQVLEPSNSCHSSTKRVTTQCALYHIRPVSLSAACSGGHPRQSCAAEPHAAPCSRYKCTHARHTLHWALLW